MASLFTRSSRRSEGLTTRSSTRNNVAINQGNHDNKQQPNIGRKKRPRGPSDHEDSSIAAKKARISIEISSQPKAHPKTRSVVIKTNEAALQRSASPPKHSAPHAKATQTEAPPPQPPRKPTNHHEKVVNGIKHELDRLQPSSTDLKAETRKLRSQEGTRFKSELSAYFPEYDEVIGNEPKEDREFPSKFYFD
jgi:hypothetical protein